MSCNYANPYEPSSNRGALHDFTVFGCTELTHPFCSVHESIEQRKPKIVRCEMVAVFKYSKTALKQCKHRCSIALAWSLACTYYHETYSVLQTPCRKVAEPLQITGNVLLRYVQWEKQYALSISWNKSENLPIENFRLQGIQREIKYPSTLSVVI